MGRIIIYYIKMDQNIFDWDIYRGREERAREKWQRDSENITGMEKEKFSEQKCESEKRVREKVRKIERMRCGERGRGRGCKSDEKEKWEWETRDGDTVLRREIEDVDN